LCVAIGPEGDFSQTEIQLAMDMGFKGLHLGESRLRTETAGLAVGVLANLG
jgi:16S rRNA (uracil1498-N3)-methyltransferase